MMSAQLLITRAPDYTACLVSGSGGGNEFGMVWVAPCNASNPKHHWEFNPGTGVMKNQAGQCLNREMEDATREGGLFVAGCYWPGTWDYDIATETLAKVGFPNNCIDGGLWAGDGPFPAYTNAGCTHDKSDTNQMWKLNYTTSDQVKIATKATRDA